MNLISNIDSIYPTGLHGLPPTRTRDLSGVVQSSGEDSVEFSRVGRALGRATEGSSFRAARLNAIRGAIEEGLLETPARIDKVVERLLDVLG